ncbi:hypothetical protein [Candidatus Parabeggiatoa sp. HSG14]|uniref:hypothetical protein n=1 Tax=Candidatus Parabeggiatoa sp. HSG14 TaxID=3055593 RepID=UPI0025A8F294|nr:hypothetical protein [Thiotrichales bacterium HSG14]
MRPLWPPLAVIKGNLLAQTEPLQPQKEELVSDTEKIAEVEVPPMPAFLKELVQKRINTQAATFSPIPTPGQILVINIDQEKSKKDNRFAPVTVLINKSTKNKKIWTGWMVASETDYASYWDMLLEPEDEPFDPLAGMIQVWNPVEIAIPSMPKVLAELKLARLQAVRAIAEEYEKRILPNDEESLPGRIAPRDTLGELSVLTGTWLGNEKTDPRCEYQGLYREVAETVCKIAQPLPESFWVKIKNWLKRLLPPLPPIPRYFLGGAIAATITFIVFFIPSSKLESPIDKSYEIAIEQYSDEIESVLPSLKLHLESENIQKSFSDNIKENFSITSKAFRAGLISGKQSLQSSSTIYKQEWLNSGRKDFFRLGRWNTLLSTVAQFSDKVSLSFWENQQKIFAQLKKDLSSQWTEEYTIQDFEKFGKALEQGDYQKLTEELKYMRDILSSLEE